ncbi:MAG: hypothetical protein CM15mP62_12450 [Rhodospirillaceae bacterium]|nr:MAG: hypothetical protein CM15mP62_12450 [Rhodospirillaceae bacterium]
MGGAMLAGWVKSRFIDDGIYVVEPSEEATRTFESIPNLTIVRTSQKYGKTLSPRSSFLRLNHRQWTKLTGS